MAWRPYENLIDGELDNTVPGKVTGWLRFFRRGHVPLTVTLDLDGDCHRDLQGRRFRVHNPDPRDRDEGAGPGSYVDGLVPRQRGSVGDMTAGGPPVDYVAYPYLEWYADNGRVVLELEPSQLEILTDEPTFAPRELDRATQHELMAGFLGELVAATGANGAAVVGAAPRPRGRKRRRAA